MPKLKSTQFLRRRKKQKEDNKLQQRKFEQAIRTELLHKLEVQLRSVDAVEFEVSERALADFLVVLEDPSITAMYDYEQVDDALFVFRPKHLF